MKAKLTKKSSSKVNSNHGNVRLCRTALAVAVSCVAGYAGTTTAHAAYHDKSGTAIGDLSIYKSSETGHANVMMMLDVSGSMGMQINPDRSIYVNSISNDDLSVNCVGSGKDGYGYWQNDHGLGVFTDSVTIGGEELDYNLQGCTPGEFTTKLGNVDFFPGFVVAYEDYRGNLHYSPFYLFKDDLGKYYEYMGRYYDKDEWYTDVPRYQRGQATYTIYNSDTNPQKDAKKWKIDSLKVDDWEWNKEKDRWVAKSKTVTIEDDSRLDRLSRLKRALIQALGTFTEKEITQLINDGKKGRQPDTAVVNNREVKAGDYKIPSENLVGLGQFSGNPKIGTDTTKHDSFTGQILLSAKPLTEEHRKKLIKTIANFDADGGTPTANAYAEAGAYMLGETTYDSSISSSGFEHPISPYENDVATIKNTTTKKYVEPGAGSAYQCYSKGIYFLTDGSPNNYVKNDSEKMMLKTLPGISNLSNYTGLTSYNVQFSDSGWDVIGKYAQALRNYDDKHEDLVTATVGFGVSFSELKLHKKTNIVNKSGSIEGIINCQADKGSKGITQDARNLCEWGSKENYTAAGDGTLSVLASDKKWGGGGFTVANSSDDIADSLIAFITSGGNLSESVPGGTITIPKDPFRGGNTAPYAYLPMIEAKTDSNTTVWKGNVKKYKTKNGTLYGEDDQRLYTSLTSTSRGGMLRDEAIDLWSKSTGSGNKAVSSGGFYAKLIAPTSSKIDGTRNVFVESYGEGDTGFTKIEVKSGKAEGFNSLTDIVYGSTAEDKNKSHKILLNFMGYNIDPFDDSLKTKDLNLKDYVPESEQRTLGGIIHSSPTLVAFSADVDEFGRVETDESKRSEYLLFGSMDGSLHLVNAKSGEEKWALVLQEMFRKQSEALVHNSAGTLKFGIDAPWVVSAKYNYKEVAEKDKKEGKSDKVTLFDSEDFGDNSKVVENTKNFLPIAAYGGFRMGGDGLYAIQPYEEDPKILFSITPDSNNAKPVLHDNKGKVLKNKSEDGAEVVDDSYNNIGQIWSRVTMARMFKSAADEKPSDVIIFGGGYDERYEDPKFVPNDSRETDPTKGSSLYIVDAKSGKLMSDVWDNPHNHSIVGGVTTLDRNADGYFDYMYFADMGGNVFRAAVVNEEGKEFKRVSVTRIFAASDELPNTKKHLAYRFYNRPVVSFYADEITSKLFAVVNLASGNRSSPLAKERNDNQYANKVYGIIDREVTTGNLLKKTEAGEYPAGTSDLTQTNLTQLNAQMSKAPSTTELLNAKLCDLSASDADKTLCKKKVSLVEPMINNTGNTGWYYPLTRFDGYDGIKNVKSVGDYRVINGTLYMSAYESDLSFEEAKSCGAEIKGVTENQLYCLPYGVCMHKSSKTGTGGFITVSRGIQELTLGALDADNTNKTVLIGTSTIQEQQAESVRLKYGEDGKKGNIATKCAAKDSCDVSKKYSNWSNKETESGDGSASIEINTSRYVLVPQRWYELNQN